MKLPNPMVTPKNSINEIFTKDIWLETNIPIKVPNTEKCKIRVNI
ncbi:uncharacterized protein METZ01_LOCUS41830 [marine metagenome]|uniref:Uncharacterized protein n=1 Tax=marine metagenome TaxID=408172 RepID=A0A381RB34_9ZZZZ